MRATYACLVSVFVLVLLFLGMWPASGAPAWADEKTSKHSPAVIDPEVIEFEAPTTKNIDASKQDEGFDIPAKSKKKGSSRRTAAAPSPLNEGYHAVNFVKIVVPEPNGKTIMYNAAETPTLTWDELMRASVYIVSAQGVRKYTYDLWAVQPFASFSGRTGKRFFLRKEPPNLNTRAETAKNPIQRGEQGVAPDPALFDKAKADAIAVTGYEYGTFWLTFEICSLASGCVGNWHDTPGWKLKISETGAQPDKTCAEKGGTICLAPKTCTGEMVTASGTSGKKTCCIGECDGITVTEPYISKISIGDPVVTNFNKDDTKAAALPLGSTFVLTLSGLNTGKPVYIFQGACPENLGEADAAGDALAFMTAAQVTGPELDMPLIAEQGLTESPAPVLMCQYADVAGAPKQDTITITKGTDLPAGCNLLCALGMMDKRLVWQIFENP